MPMKIKVRLVSEYTAEVDDATLKEHGEEEVLRQWKESLEEEPTYALEPGNANITVTVEKVQ